MNTAKAILVRQRLSNIQQSYPGHKDAMLLELDHLEERAEVGDAFVWALQEGIITNVAVKPLVKKYREAVDGEKM